METIKQIYQSSLFYTLLQWIGKVALPQARCAFFSSGVWRLWCWVDRVVIHSKYIQFVVNPQYLTNAWYNSFFYRKTTFGIRRLSFAIPRSTLSYRCEYIGLFLALVLAIPQKNWADVYIIPPFLVLAILYISHNISFRTGTVFVLVNVVVVLFLLLMELALPYRAVATLGYLMLSIDFFFLISFSVRTMEDMNRVLRWVFITLFALCSVEFVQQRTGQLPAGSTFKDGTTFGEILILLFPFAFVYPLGMESLPRKMGYITLLLILSFTAVTATQSKAAFLGYSVELVLLILLIDWRYMPVLLVLAPAISRTALQNIVQMWTNTPDYGNFFTNLVYAFRNFWDNGFGVSRDVFLDIYRSTALEASTGHAMVELPYLKLSPVYFNIVLDLGALAMFGFLYYILRLAHSVLTSLVTSHREHRILFAAGLSTLIGISVSSLLASSLFSPRTLLVYWGMLGLLRAARIMKLGIT